MENKRIQTQSQIPPAELDATKPTLNVAWPDVKPVLADIMRDKGGVTCDPMTAFKTYGTYLIANDAKDGSLLPQNVADAQKNLRLSVGLETHHAIAETVREDHRPLLIEVIREVEQEYDCKTPTEKMLAELAVAAYIRTLAHSRMLEPSTRDQYPSHKKTTFYAMHAKEVDRAHRQFMTAIATLKQIKNPSITLNVNAKTAFVAQNQQINVSAAKPQEKP